MKNIILFFVVIILFINVVISFRNKTNFSFVNKVEKLYELNDKVIINNNLEDYVVGVVACEMPASFDEEALKSQAIAARTNALKSSNQSLDYDWVTNVTSQCYINKVEMENKWYDNYQYYYDKIYGAVYDTAGIVIEYDNELINAYYFSMSNGYTEDSLVVFGKSLPYIDVVYSLENENLNNFLSTKKVDIEDFKKKLNINEDNIIINSINYDDSNRVLNIIVNDVKYDGIYFRKIFGLRSTDFDLTVDNDSVVFVTKGYGHGVGMSQYGANLLALKHKSYSDILSYYYKNVELVNFYV